MHLQPEQAAQVVGIEQLLHLMRNGQLALHPLLFLLLRNQVGQRLRHGVERLLQRRHLIVGAELNAMLKFAAIDVLGRGIQLGHRFCHAARQTHANEQRDQLDDAEDERDRQQQIAEDAGVFSQGAEQRGIDP